MVIFENFQDHINVQEEDSGNSDIGYQVLNSSPQQNIILFQKRALAGANKADNPKEVPWTSLRRRD